MNCACLPCLIILLCHFIVCFIIICFVILYHNFYISTGIVVVVDVVSMLRVYLTFMCIYVIRVVCKQVVVVLISYLWFIVSLPQTLVVSLVLDFNASASRFVASPTRPWHRIPFILCCALPSTESPINNNNNKLCIVLFIFGCFCLFILMLRTQTCFKKYISRDV